MTVTVTRMGPLRGLQHMTLTWRTVAKGTVDRARLDDHYFQCGDTEAGAPYCTVGESLPGGTDQATVPVRGRAWTCTEAFLLTEACLSSWTCPWCWPNQTHGHPWLTMKSPHPLDFPTGPDFSAPHPGALVRSGSGWPCPVPRLDHRSPPLVECSHPGDL